jgi:D-2-hydroxyacid dehydrogenase (NADP+)
MAPMPVLAFTSKNPEKQAKFRAMVEESGVLRDKVDLIISSSEEEALAALPEVEVFLCYRFPPEWLPKAKKLKWLHVGWAGMDHVLTPELLKSNIRLTNARGIHVDVQSDCLIGLMVMWSRKLLWADRFRRDRMWQEWRKPMVMQGFPLKGRVLLIIGLGAIGKTLAKKANGMEMAVHGIKRHAEAGNQFQYVRKMWEPRDLNEALGQVDFVVPLVPLTPETRGMFGRELFQKMKPTAFFINTSRGQVVDERALIYALEEKWIAGAALDVFQEEPLPQDSPLWDMDNVILTPHIGGNYPEYTMDVYRQFVVNLENYVRGEPLDNEVNKELWY